MAEEWRSQYDWAAAKKRIFDRLGVDENTDPDDPSTWSDRLKAVHASHYEAVKQDPEFDESEVYADEFLPRTIAGNPPAPTPPTPSPSFASGKSDYERNHTPIREPEDHGYAFPWPSVKCAFCGDIMAGQHFHANHGATENGICIKAAYADPRSQWAKNIGIDEKFNEMDPSTWSPEVERRAMNALEVNGPVHPETDEPVHTGKYSLTLRNPQYEDGEEEPSREEIIKNGFQYDPATLEYYKNIHQITDAELKGDVSRETSAGPTGSSAAPTVESTTASSSAVPSTIIQTAENGSSAHQIPVTGPNGEYAGHFGIWKNPKDQIIGTFGPYSADAESSPAEEMRGMSNVLFEKLKGHIKKYPTLHDGSSFSKAITMPSNENLYKQLGGAPTDMGDNEPEEDDVSRETSDTPQSVNTAHNVSQQMAGSVSVTPTDAALAANQDDSTKGTVTEEYWSDLINNQRKAFEYGKPNSRDAKAAQKELAQYPLLQHHADIRKAMMEAQIGLPSKARDEDYLQGPNDSPEYTAKVNRYNELRNAAKAISSHVASLKASLKPMSTDMAGLDFTHLLGGLAADAPAKVDPTAWQDAPTGHRQLLREYISQHESLATRHTTPSGELDYSPDAMSSLNDLHKTREKMEKGYGAENTYNLIKNYPLGVLQTEGFGEKPGKAPKTPSMPKAPVYNTRSQIKTPFSYKLNGPIITPGLPEKLEQAKKESTRRFIDEG